MVRAFPDFYFGSKILEVKTSWGAFKPQQAAALAVHAKEQGKQLAYLFYKRPTDEQLEEMRKVVRAAAGDDVEIIVNYLFR